jgi:hypothetical protein
VEEESKGDGYEYDLPRQWKFDEIFTFESEEVKA